MATIKRSARPKRKPVRSATQRRRVVKHAWHVRFLRHPMSIMVLLAIGVVMAGLTFQTGAVSYTVTGKVPAPALSEPAIITSVSDGDQEDTSPITITGTCPQNSYVKLSRNGAFSGADTCSSDQTFSITTDLSDGDNQLVPQDYNITNDPGPTVPAITITYVPPPAIIPAPNEPASLLPIVEAPDNTSPVVIPSYDDDGYGPLRVSSQYQYQSFTTNTHYSWSVTLQGGTPPYNVTVNWGDGTTSDLIFKTDPTFNIDHQYKKAGTYRVMLSSLDAKNVKVVMQLSAVVKPSNIATSTTGIISPNSAANPSTPTPARIKTWLWLLWPSYAIILLMAVSFYLGERQEYLDLFKKHKRRTHTR